jgi:RNA polymerase sigma factor (sigma-70 family)
MNIQGPKYETKTEADALAWIEHQVGKKMKRCVFPTRPCLNYYISRNGIMYGCRWFWRAKKYVAYQCFTRKNTHAEGPLYRMYTVDGQAHKLAARLIWCTWVLGYWSDKAKVRYKDGNPNHIDLSNLAELNEEWKIREEHAENMRKFEAIYRREFKVMVHDVRWKMGILEDEAKDAVQEAFIAITRNHDGNMQYFGANWMVMAQKIAMSYIQQKDTFRPIDDVPNDRATGKWDRYNVSNILAPIKDEKDRRALELVAQGATITEICEEIGISRTNITRRLHRAREICKDYLSTDREIMKMYN